MKILMVAPESVPFVKVGGLADVVGALSSTLASKGHDVRLVLPKYASLNISESLKLIEDSFMRVHLGAQDAYTRVWTTQFPDSSARAYFLEYNLFFEEDTFSANSYNALLLFFSKFNKIVNMILCISLVLLL